MGTDKDFNNAKFYDADTDPETLTHEDPEVAIIEYFDDRGDTGQELLDWIERACPIKVDAYTPKEVEDSWVQREAEYLFETFEERFDEEYGDLNGDFRAWKNEDHTLCKQAIAQALRTTLERARVWQCEKVATREYSAKEVEAILRDSCPEWFEETKWLFYG